MVFAFVGNSPEYSSLATVPKAYKVRGLPEENPNVVKYGFFDAAIGTQLLSIMLLLITFAVIYRWAILILHVVEVPYIPSSMLLTVGSQLIVVEPNSVYMGSI
jgi:hypothetical protein